MITPPLFCRAFPRPALGRNHSRRRPLFFADSLT